MCVGRGLLNLFWLAFMVLSSLVRVPVHALVCIRVALTSVLLVRVVFLGVFSCVLSCVLVAVAIVVLCLVGVHF